MPAPAFHSRSFPALTSLLIVSALLAPSAPAQSAPIVRPAPPTLLADFDVNVGTVQSLTVLGNQQNVYRVPVMLGADLRTLELSPHDVRAPNFQLLVQDHNGVHVEPTPPSITYRGTLVEEPNARVAATIVDGKLDAVVQRAPTGPTAPGVTWIVQPVQSVAPNAGASLHIVYRADDSTPLPYVCGTDTSGMQPNPTPAVGTDSPVLCEIAIEADREFWLANGANTTLTQNDVTSIMNQIDFIYDRDVDVTFTVTTILVTTTQVYTTNDAGNLLNQFQNNWNATHGGIQRDTAHLFTGRNLNGSTIGLAYLSVICNTGYAYGLSESRFSNNFNRRVGLTAHELGHNFSAPHCDGNNPCYIMCSGLGGCSGNTTLFSPSAINTIMPYAQASTCLPHVPTPPVLTSVSPNAVTVFAPGFVQLGGSGLATVQSYTVGGQTLSSGISVQGDTSITVRMPEGAVLGATTISVTNVLGTSNALPINYTLTSPPKLVQTAAIPAVGGTAQFDFAGTPGRAWFFVIGLSAATTPFQGLDLISNPLLFHTGSFQGPLGVDGFSVPVPGGLGLILLYTQVLEADLTGVATGVSNVRVIILQ